MLATISSRELSEWEAFHFLENEADELLNKAVAELFEGKDVIMIIKYKELYEDLERMTDVCEDVSNLLRDIVLKHS